LYAAEKLGEREGVGDEGDVLRIISTMINKNSYIAAAS
jgi:hypothetical protein